MPHNRCAALSSDGNRLAVMDGHLTRIWILDISDGTVPKHNFEKGREWWLRLDLAFQLENGFAFEGVFSPDDSQFAIATSHSDIILLDANSGTKLRTLAGHSGAVMSLAFSSDGLLLASGGADRTVRVWDVETGDARTTLVGHSGEVISVAFTTGTDSRQNIASWDMAGNVLVWPSATKTEVESTVEYWSARGRRHDQQHEFTHAESDWQRIVELRPNAGQQIWLDRGRRFALQGEWQASADSFAHYQGSIAPESDLGFEIACAHVIVGDVTSYRRLLNRLVTQAGETPSPAAAYVLARTANLLPQNEELTQRAVQWAKLAHSTSSSPWRVHSLGVAQFRAGDDAKALETLSTSASTSWGGNSQNQIVLARLFIASGDQKLAQQLLALAGESERQKNIRTTQNVIDWLAYNALLHEVESQLDGQAKEASPQYLAEAETAWTSFLESRVPDIERFDTLIAREEWVAAAELGWRIVELNPNDSMGWLRLAPTLVLSGDEAAYQEFCVRMNRQFAGTADMYVADQTCKACLLLPDKIDIDTLPLTLLAAVLDDGTASTDFAPWGWSARALVAYRRGRAADAVAYVQESEGLQPSPMAHALNLVTRAMAHTQLGEIEKAKSDVTAASKILDQRITIDPHDVWIGRILLEEAKSKLVDPTIK